MLDTFSADAATPRTGPAARDLAPVLARELDRSETGMLGYITALREAGKLPRGTGGRGVAAPPITREHAALALLAIGASATASGAAQAAEERYRGMLFRVTALEDYGTHRTERDITTEAFAHGVGVGFLGPVGSVLAGMVAEPSRTRPDLTLSVASVVVQRSSPMVAILVSVDAPNLPASAVQLVLYYRPAGAAETSPPPMAEGVTLPGSVFHALSELFPSPPPAEPPGDAALVA